MSTVTVLPKKDRSARKPKSPDTVMASIQKLPLAEKIQLQKLINVSITKHKEELQAQLALIEI